MTIYTLSILAPKADCVFGGFFCAERLLHGGRFCAERLPSQGPFLRWAVSSTGSVFALSGSFTGAVFALGSFLRRERFCTERLLLQGPLLYGKVPARRGRFWLGAPPPAEQLLSQSGMVRGLARRSEQLPSRCETWHPCFTAFSQNDRTRTFTPLEINGANNVSRGTFHALRPRYPRIFPAESGRIPINNGAKQLK